jgi:hypothetical protein
MFTGLILSGMLAAAPQLPPTSTTTEAATPDKPDRPFAQLFAAMPPDAEQPGTSRPPTPARRTSGPRTKVVCGMTLLLVGPDADAGMARPTPKDGVTYTMRRYPPPMCGQDR